MPGWKEWLTDSGGKGELSQQVGVGSGGRWKGWPTVGVSGVKPSLAFPRLVGDGGVKSGLCPHTLPLQG